MKVNEYKVLLRKFYKILNGMREDEASNYINDLYTLLSNIKAGHEVGIGRKANLKNAEYGELVETIEDMEQDEKFDVLDVAKKYFNSMATENAADKRFARINQIFNKELFAVQARQPLGVHAQDRYKREYIPNTEFKNPKSWLKNTLNRLTNEGAFGTFKIQDNVTGSEPKANSYTITISGELPIQYAANIFFKKGLGLLNVPPITNENQNTSAYTVDRKTLIKFMREHQIYEAAAAWLNHMGFSVKTGGKYGDEVFVNCEGIDSNPNDKTAIEKSNISLAAAQKIMNEYKDSYFVFPSTVQLEIDTIDRKDQLNRYYSEAGLFGANEKSKEFILAGPSKRETNRTNIGGMVQVKKLMHYFERLDMISKMTNTPIKELDKEEMVVVAQQSLRDASYKALKEMSEKSQNLAIQSGDSSYLAIEVRNQPAGGARQIGWSSRDYSQAADVESAYERKMEQLINEEHVLGPDAYFLLVGTAKGNSVKPNTPLSLTYGLQNLEQSGSSNEAVDSSALVVRNEMQLSTTVSGLIGTNDDKSDCSMAELMALSMQIKHPNLVSNAAFNTQEKDRILGRLKTHAQTLYWDKREEFKRTHSPFYFVKSISSKIVELVDKLDEDGLKTMLELFDIKGEDLKYFYVKGTNQINRYQVKFEALNLAFNYCIKAGIILNFKAAVNSPKYKDFFMDDEGKNSGKKFRSTTAGNHANTIDFKSCNALDISYYVTSSADDKPKYYSDSSFFKESTDVAGGGKEKDDPGETKEPEEPNGG